MATNNARAKIRQWFKKEAREENVQRGRELLEKELRRLGALTALMKPDKLREAAPKFNVGSDEDLLAALGNGDVSLLSVVTALRGEVPAPEAPAPVVPAPAAPSAGGGRGAGADHVLTRFSLCCPPLPRGRGVGYVTPGGGGSIPPPGCPKPKIPRPDPGPPHQGGVGTC